MSFSIKGLSLVVASSLLLLVCAFLPAPAQAGDSYLRVRDAHGSPEFRAVKRFGNRQRLGKRIDPRLDRVDDRRFYEREVVSGNSQIVGLRRFGNRKRIAKLIDPVVPENADRVVVVSDPQGRGEFVAIKRFGNRRRIARLTGQK